MSLLAATLLVLGVICYVTGHLLPAGTPKARIFTLVGVALLPTAILVAGLA